MNAIELKNIRENYQIKFVRDCRVLWEHVAALDDVSVTIKSGETVGIVGHNGAGKTTLLKLVAGMLQPDAGDVVVKGRVSALMDLGAGFNPELTGRQNIAENARLYGIYDAKDVRLEEIMAFADLGKFIDAPIKCYSHGMFMRLAFALAIHVNPDIFLIDDILAVGDEEAQQKCRKKILEMKKQGRTILIVSHDLHMLSRICDRMILIEHGKIVCDGGPDEVAARYLETIGPPSGIARLARGDLQIVFNHGKFFIRYRGVPVTSFMGVHTNYFLRSLNAWFSSVNSRWQIRFSTDSILEVEGILPDGEIFQEWRLSFTEGRLWWEITTRGDAIREWHAVIFLRNDYNRFVHGEMVEFFPEFQKAAGERQMSEKQQPGICWGLMPDTDKSPHLTLQNKATNVDDTICFFDASEDRKEKAVRLKTAQNNARLLFSFFTDPELFLAHIRTEQQAFFEEEQRKEAERQALRLQEQRRQQALRLQEQQRKEAEQQALCTLGAENMRLFVDLSEKKIRVFFHEKEITQGCGLHSCILFRQRWFDTSACDWTVTKREEGLNLELRWPFPGFLQKWSFSFTGQKLHWYAEMTNPSDVSLGGLKIGLCLLPEYKTFFAGRQEASFPSDAPLTWESFPLDDSRALMFGCRKGPELPAVIVENHQKYVSLVESGDIKNPCRVLQVWRDAQEVSPFEITLDFSDDTDKIDAYIRAEQQVFLEEQRRREAEEQERQISALREQQRKEAEERQRQIQARTIADGEVSLFVDTERKKISLFFQQQEITAGSGLHAAFWDSVQWQNPQDAQWEVRKIAENELEVLLTYPSSLVSFWRLRFAEDHRLHFSVGMRSQAPFAVFRHDIRMDLSRDYDSWATLEERGFFVEAQFLDNFAPVRLKDGRTPFVIFSSRERKVPHFLMKHQSSAAKVLTGIHRAIHNDGEISCLNFSYIFRKKDGPRSPGEYKMAEAVIAVGENSRETAEGVLKPEKRAEIASEPRHLLFVFNDGTGQVLWKGKELTTGLGAYTSFRSRGVWHDSSQAVWEIKKNTVDEIVICGEWAHLPLTQIWTLRWLKPDVLNWHIDMEFDGVCDLELGQVNLMLTSAYKKWFVSECARGDFPDDFSSSYDIIPFRSWYGKASFLGARHAGGVPAVILAGDTGASNWRALVENSDRLYGARLIQYQRSDFHRQEAGRQDYFHGTIRIEP